MAPAVSGVSATARHSELRLESAVYRSIRGSKRDTNEDGVLCLSQVPLFAVADGTGGREPARVALTALERERTTLAEKNARVRDDASTTSRLALGRFLEAAFARANGEVFEAARRIPGRRIATTLCAATVVGSHAFVAHVGDSRAYLWREGRLRRLTNDHTLAARQLDRGAIGPDAYAASPLRFSLAQALGMSRALEVDLLELHLFPGDHLLLTTDGLTRALSEEVIAACLAEGEAPDASADRLIAAVNKAGAPDDTSFILIATASDPPTRAPLQEPARSLHRVDLDATVRNSFLFADLVDSEWHQIQPYLELVESPAGATLCLAGQAAPGFGVVVQGSLEVQYPSGEVRTIGPGGHFGTLALGSTGTSHESLSSIEPSRVYLLSRPRFLELVRLKPILGSRLTLNLLETLGQDLALVTARLGQVVDAANGKVRRSLKEVPPGTT